MQQRIPAPTSICVIALPRRCFSGSDLSGGDFSGFSWRAADITNCDLRRSVTGELDIRRTNLEGVKIDYEQASSLLAFLGITVTE
ncbi:TPA: pentapeptide repeat-containing protein [Salmonella enterica subsp. enterica serovar Infantis]|nr:pentapeptide repeat-containing protein [Salmonella enterica subsp. enterica serovar Infantis]HCD0612579.1 pentapeptide repeat-containing protein [Salmonella enterica subsp. enterica serovar Infantis]